MQSLLLTVKRLLARDRCEATTPSIAYLVILCVVLYCKNQGVSIQISKLLKLYSVCRRQSLE